jgi:NADH:ubiquinone oxidoreductase subunit 4 (subunit M)
MTTILVFSFAVLLFDRVHLLLFLYLLYYIREMGVRSLGEPSFVIVILSFTLITVVLGFNRDFKDNFYIILVFILSVVFFNSSDLVSFFISFELSLVVVTLFLISRGDRETRITSGLYMFFYTIVFSLVFLIGLVKIFIDQGTLFIDLLGIIEGGGLSVSLMLGFLLLVKAPLVLLHFWLPRAHVDSPVEGSMVLAGLILKMSGFGIILLSSIIFLDFNIKMALVLWRAISCLLVSGFCYLESDLKKVVAYSSILHISYSIMSLSLSRELSYYFCLLVMFSHGLCSPIIFWGLNNLYMKSGVRNIRRFSGAHIFSPGYSLIFSISLMINLNIPPLLGFWAEVLSISLLVFSSLMFVPLIIRLFMIIGMFNVLLNSKFVIKRETSERGHRFELVYKGFEFVYIVVSYLFWSVHTWLFY